MDGNLLLFYGGLQLETVVAVSTTVSSICLGTVSNSNSKAELFSNRVFCVEKLIIKTVCILILNWRKFGCYWNRWQKLVVFDPFCLGWYPRVWYFMDSVVSRQSNFLGIFKFWFNSTLGNLPRELITHRVFFLVHVQAPKFSNFWKIFDNFEKHLTPKAVTETGQYSSRHIKQTEWVFLVFL